MNKWHGCRTIFAIAGTVLLLAASFGRAAAQSNSPSDVFTESAASKLLGEMAEGLRSHSAYKLLSTFDLSRMDDGTTFKQQITAFFNHYEIIRVHLKLVEVKDNVAIVDGEIDGTPRNAADPPQHKNLQLRFTAASTSAGWKFIDVQPRDFFS